MILYPGPKFYYLHIFDFHNLKEMIIISRLNVRPIDYPQTKDAIAMVNKLTYEDMYDKALRYIFGRTLICRNLEIATQLARTTGLDCVTLDGDQVSSKGSLTGGYFNKSRSRLEIQKTRSEKTEEIAQQDEDMRELRGKLNDIESDINRVVSEMQKTETKNSKAKDVFEKVKTDVRLYKEELNNIGKSHKVNFSLFFFEKQNFREIRINFFYSLPP